MPGGDTVWLAGRRLHEALAGRTLTRTDFRVPRLATVDLSGRAVREVVSHGKHLAHPGGAGPDSAPPLPDGRHVAPVSSRPPPARRSSLAGTGGAGAEWQAVGYRLPVLELLSTVEETRVIGHPAPTCSARTGTSPRRSAPSPASPTDRSASLAQHNLAGVGNLYKTEVCFLRGVSPWTPVRDVPDLPGLVELARLDLNRNRPSRSRPATRPAAVGLRAGRPSPARRCDTSVVLAEQGQPGRLLVPPLPARSGAAAAPRGPPAAPGRIARVPALNARTALSTRDAGTHQVGNRPRAHSPAGLARCVSRTWRRRNKPWCRRRGETPFGARGVGTARPAARVRSPRRTGSRVSQPPGVAYSLSAEGPLLGARGGGSEAPWRGGGVC
ncbi:Formamidopyrimidine-DNA glycosylase [Carbonactinospora thermoautotrophica]|uniref:DNA-(apurinic or apyrimidinic site) lyase n=1 Tax=Carbonactinospora thermoautotrophica TaxID=1469144 RepID=A0A132MPT2_9ACTN|nr:Formamidopyrimidine-DNA glycosylase [Carbonactinospora thermoautotrophica]